MKYEVIYNKLMSRARSRTLEGYFERHHVVPRCLGGSDCESNIVSLTAEEHFLAHVLLVKIHPNERGLIFAVHQMCNGTSRTTRPTRRLYGWLRRKHAETIAELNRVSQTGSRNSQFGSRWITNGETSMKIPKDQPVPDGFVVGRKMNLNEASRERFRKAKVGTKRPDVSLRNRRNTIPDGDGVRLESATSREA